MLSQDKVIEVYTIGHSNRSLDKFLELLKKYRIEIVVDVRRFPSSKRYPHFKKEDLERTLKERNLKYIWLGDKLGGFRPGGYESYIKTEDFKEGLSSLLRIIEENKDKKTTIMCRERLWFKCHRRFISDILVWLGYRVVHIIDKDKTYVHKRSREFKISTDESNDDLILSKF